MSSVGSSFSIDPGGAGSPSRSSDVAAGLAAWGLVDVYLVPLQWWRDSGVPGWYSEQLGISYRCLSGLPENWILNTDEESPARRLVSTFLSPLATAYALTIVLLLLACARPRRSTIVVGLIAYAGLLWTHTRAAFLVLAVGLLVVAALRRSWTPAVLAGVTARRLCRVRRRLPGDRAGRRPTPRRSSRA